MSSTLYQELGKDTDKTRQEDNGNRGHRQSGRLQLCELNVVDGDDVDDDDDADADVEDGRQRVF